MSVVKSAEMIAAPEDSIRHDIMSCIIHLLEKSIGSSESCKRHSVGVTR